MQYSTNYNLNKPQAADQFNIEHWNQNTDTIDSQMHTNEVGIAANKADISALLANLTTNKASETNSTYFKLMKLIYPVGSIYWSGNSTNPASLFGGTWVQIKDRFVWAKGDSDALNSTGGEKTHTLSVNEMPSHSHNFSGNSVTTSNGGVDHVHGINHRHYTGGTTSTVDTNHTHSFSTDSRLSNGYFKIGVYGGGNNGAQNALSEADGTLITKSLNSGNGKGIECTGNYHETVNRFNIYAQHSHSGTTGASNGEHSSITHNHTWGEWSTTPRVWGNEGVERLNSDGASAYLHTHTVTVSGSISNAGGGNAHNNMPPYIVKYCWERTA